MTTRKNSSSTIKVTKGDEVVYLSNRDEVNGLDILLDLQGYTLTAL